MKKILKILTASLFAGFIIAQFIRPDRTNPAVVQSESLQSSTSVPAEVQTLLSRSCSDCHSNETSYPWYSNISPFSWFLADHIEEGRRELNFSIWNTYSPAKKNKKLDEICEQVEAHAMPLPSYLWLHGNASLADSDIKLLCDWTITAKSVSASPN